MGHKYNKRDGTWRMHYRFCDTTTIVRTCPKCGFYKGVDTSKKEIANKVEEKKAPKKAKTTKKTEE